METPNVLHKTVYFHFQCHFLFPFLHCPAAANQAIVATATSIFVKQTLATSSHDLWTTRLTLHMQGTTALAVHAGLGRVFWINKLEKVQ